jgi:hypothetical protein
MAFLTHAPDLDNDGVFSFKDFSNLYDQYKKYGLVYGEPVLPDAVLVMIFYLFFIFVLYLIM